MNNSRSIILAFGWVSGAQYISTAIRFLGSVYLARRIAPVFFGQQGLALSVVMLSCAFIMLGENYALIRQQKDIDKYIQTLFFIRLSIFTILIFVMLFLWSAGLLLGSEKVQFYTILLFFSQIPAQVMSLHISYVTKKMLFRRLALLNFIPTFSAIILACVLAYLGYTIWALLWLFMTENLIRAILTFILTPKIFLPNFNKSLALDFFHYSKYFISISLLGRFNSKIANISIGSLVGEVPLGYYCLAYGIGGLLQQTIMGGVGTVTQPYFAKMQGNRERLGKNFEFISSLLVRISCGEYVCLAIILPNFITLLYGEKWLPTVPVFRLLLPFAVLQTFRTILRNTHKIAGSVKLLTFAQITEVFFLLIFIYPMIYWKGMVGVIIVVKRNYS